MLAHIPFILIDSLEPSTNHTLDDYMHFRDVFCTEHITQLRTSHSKSKPPNAYTEKEIYGLLADLRLPGAGTAMPVVFVECVRVCRLSLEFIQTSSCPQVILNQLSAHHKSSTLPAMLLTNQCGQQGEVKTSLSENAALCLEQSRNSSTDLRESMADSEHPHFLSAIISIGIVSGY